MKFSLKSSQKQKISPTSSTFKTVSYHCSTLDASKTALLIVDVQPEYWSESPQVRRDFPDFPKNISSLIQNCRERNAKRIIWIRADYSYERSPWLYQFSRLHEGRIQPIVRPSNKWEKFASPLEDEMIINKTSWSATTSGAGLLDTLKRDGIDTVLVCGLITSVCVQHTAFGVFEAGFRTILVDDACADRGRKRHDAALSLYGDYMYELRTVDSVRVELKEEEQKEKTKKKKKSWLGSVGGSVMTRRYKMAKSKSTDSLTTAMSIDDSISTIDGGADELLEYRELCT
jgi:nicotinamidase-related amidase